MPVSRKDFELGNFPLKRHTDRATHPILLFLKENSNYSYTIKEIAKELETKEATLRTTLRLLIKDGYVEHKQPQFIFKKPKNNK